MSGPDVEHRARLWRQVQEFRSVGVSQREIARRLGLNRRTVARLVQAEAPPRYQRSRAGSMLDPLEPVLLRVVAEHPAISAPSVARVLRQEHGYSGSVDLVKKRLATLRPAPTRASAPHRCRPGELLELRWAPIGIPVRIADRHRRVFALVASLPFSGAQTCHFSLEASLDALLEGHVRILRWLGGVPHRCLYLDPSPEPTFQWAAAAVSAAPARALRRHYGFEAKPSRVASADVPPADHRPTFRPPRSLASLAELDHVYAGWRDRIANQRQDATGTFWVHERLVVDRARLRSLPLADFDHRGRRMARVRPDGFIEHDGSRYRVPDHYRHRLIEVRFDRDYLWLCRDGVALARHERRYDDGRHHGIPEGGTTA